MEEEVLTLKEEGVTGFVFGCLTSARTIDFPSMTR
jgi:copper homeostasis protein CutC